MIKELEDLDKWVAIPFARQEEFSPLSAFIRMRRGLPVIPPSLLCLWNTYGKELLLEKAEVLSKMANEEGPGTAAFATLELANGILRKNSVPLGEKPGTVTEKKENDHAPEPEVERSEPEPSS